MKRSKCGYEDREGAGFCGGCGHYLVEPAPKQLHFHLSPPHLPMAVTGSRNSWVSAATRRSLTFLYDTIPDRDVASAIFKAKKWDDALEINNRHLQEHVVLTRYSGHLRESDHA